MDVSVFDYGDYKKFLKDHLQSLPREGHGELKRIAGFLRIHPVVMSQVLHGSRHLTAEQSCDLADYLGFQETPKDYLLLLVQRARSGSYRLNEALDRQMKETRARGQNLKKLLPLKEAPLTPEDLQRFHSSWQFSASRLFYSIHEQASLEDLSRRLSISLERAREITQFLLKTGLLVRKGDRFQLGTKSMHLPADSPHITQHRMNWRLKALERQPSPGDPFDLSYSGLMALSEEASLEVRKLITRFLEKATKEALESKSERLMLLNVDWLQI